ncbi:MAG: hypothetical protein QXH81_08890 [Thermofilaceae archaeon]
MIFWVVETRDPILRDRREDDVMDSAVNYLKCSPRRAYNPRRLIVDSGAYTAARKGLRLDAGWVMRVQEKLRADYAVPLDYPFAPGVSVDEARRRVELTLENLALWVERFGAKTVPVVHAVGWNGLRSVMERVSRVAGEADMVALGCIALDGLPKGFLGDRQPHVSNVLSLLTALRLAKEEYSFKVHLTGFGSSPLTLNLAVYMGADSIDTSGSRRRAAYGKILLPGRGERYVGRGDAAFGVAKPDERDLKLLEECKCPVCRINPGLLWRDWRARAIHNEHVLKVELEKAVRMAEDVETYERYLDQLFARSPLRGVWRMVKAAARSPPLIAPGDDR